MSVLDCEFCKQGCFPSEEDGCIAITFSNQSLGVEQGVDSLKTALIKICDAIQCLKDNECDPCNKCKGGSETTSFIGNVTTNLPLKSTTNVPATIKIIPSSTNTSVEYNVKDAVASQGSGKCITKVNVFGSVNGVSGKIHSSSSEIGSFTAAPENFPLTLDVETTLLSSSGQKNISLQRTLLNSSNEINTPLEVTDLSRTSIETQKDVNELLDSRINSVSNEINSLQNVNVNGVKGINSVFANIQSQLDNLKKTMDGDTSDNSTVESIQSQINDAITTLNNQESRILQIEQTLLNTSSTS